MGLSHIDLKLSRCCFYAIGFLSLKASEKFEIANEWARISLCHITSYIGMCLQGDREESQKPLSMFSLSDLVFFLSERSEGCVSQG